MTENKTKNSTNNKEIDDLDIEVQETSSAIKDNSEEKTVDKTEEGVVVPKSKIVLVKKILTNIKENNDQLAQLLSAFVTKEEEERIGIAQASDDGFLVKPADENLVGGRIVEGVFDGEGMVGSDGKHYSIPANYASKSKLVEGDIMKLTITPNGTFVYKQIGPIERSRLVGELEQESSGNYYANVEGKRWKVLTASVTYYKGQLGDEVVILVPKNGVSNWAAVENIVRKIS
ncbi:MAG: hypothetical protein BWY51_00377 [Parcubacteria group bacterium ADurb.Bin316]|nr:MAG: hypothetical protein BWY51_00377 [Parcubacteria group bacterium ADurb.Bin316]HOZ55937.1 hypothetical protein [bacterium]